MRRLVAVGYFHFPTVYLPAYSTEKGGEARNLSLDGRESQVCPLLGSVWDAIEFFSAPTDLA